MDADFKEKRRERISSQREKRWSMNSQRLEEIVAELMRPIGDLRHSFDTDLSALLEEYLTEAGLHALSEEEEEEGAGGGAPPNFAELALLLQQSASIYGRKVDCLYQRVLAVSDSLHTSTIEITNGNNADEPQTPSTGRRKRKPSVSGFEAIEVERCGAAAREAGAARPPPTLPRMYLELEPRQPAAGERPLTDCDGEPIGLLADFHVTWRLQDGLLVDELEGTAPGGAALRPLPLLELQAAIAAAAPPSPPPLRGDESPPRCSTPLPAGPAPAPAGDGDVADAPAEMPPPAPPPVKRERKRRSEFRIEELEGGTVKLHISQELRMQLSIEREFDGAAPWAARVVAERAARIVRRRRELRGDGPPEECRGLEYSSLDVSGFGGWSSAEAADATAALQMSRVTSLSDSDDDGFFEQSSLGDSDGSRPDETALSLHTTLSAEALEMAEWRARVAARAGAGERRPPPDIRALAASVLAALGGAEGAGGAACPIDSVLRGAAKEPADVSRLFLATLFLANAGNVEVEQGPVLSLNSFSLRLRSRDESLYCAVAAAEPPR